MDIVLAAHSREVKTALYLAINARTDVTVVATANSTGELASYCHAFLPDVAIIEAGLPGRTLREVLTDLGEPSGPRRILIIGGETTQQHVDEFGRSEVLQDIDHLDAILTDFERENGIR